MSPAPGGSEKTAQGKGARRRGLDLERKAEGYFQDHGFPVRRTAPAGYPGTDLLIDIAHSEMLMDVKNWKGMALSAWCKQAEADAIRMESEDGKRRIHGVYHKNRGQGDPHKQFVTMYTGQFLRIMQRLSHLEALVDQLDELSATRLRRDLDPEVDPF